MPIASDESLEKIKERKEEEYMMNFPTYSAQSEQDTAAMVSALPQIIGNSTTDDKTLVLHHDFHANSSAFSQNQSHQQNQDQGFNFMTEGDSLPVTLMEPNLRANGADFEDLITIWSPQAMGYHSDNLGFLTHEEITTQTAACFPGPQLPISTVGGGLNFTKGDLCHRYMDTNNPNQYWTLPNGEYVESMSPSELFTDCDYSGHPGSFPQEYSHEDMPTIMDGSELDICNNSQATHQPVVGSSSPASGPQPAETDILCHNVEGRTTRTYHNYTPQEVQNLINGVEKYKYSYKGRINWKSIKKLDYFKDTPGTENQLKWKWNDMLKSEDTEAHSEMKDLYVRAKNLAADLRNNKKKKDTTSNKKKKK